MVALLVLVAYAGLQSTFAQPAAGGPRLDRVPKPPGAPQVSAASATSVVVKWEPGRDNVAVVGYGVYLDGVKKATTPGTVFGFASLVCGKAYGAAVDAVDAAGNRSSRSNSTVTTAACVDLEAPTAPSGVIQVATTETTVTLRWSPSRDNVGVVGYGIYVAGLRVGSVSEAYATLDKLTCNSSYQIGIDAYDAAGNRSARTDVLVLTSPCPDRQAPSAPGNLEVSSSTTTSIDLSWSPASDNVGVTGYGLIVGGSRAQTVASTRGSFTGLTCGRSYALGVDAADAAGNRSSASTLVPATKACSSGPDTEPPAKPLLSLGPATKTTLVLNWQASGQRRDRPLQRLPGQVRPARRPDEGRRDHGSVLHLHRPDVRHRLLARSRCRGRRRQPVDPGRGDLVPGAYCRL